MDLASYRVADFIPFSPEIFRALLQNYNSSLWPLQAIWLAASLGITLWIFRRPQGVRMVGFYLAAAWVGTGQGFFLGHFQQIFEPALFLGWAFTAQGLFLLGAGAGLVSFSLQQKGNVRFYAGGLLFLVSAFLPFDLLLGRTIQETALLGWGPDATALGTLGFLLMTRGSPWRWLLALFPVVWVGLAALLYYGLATQ